MKSKLGMMIGFVIGLGGFLSLFKLFVLPAIPPNDEIAPGLVLFAGIMSGVVFGYFGYLIQRRYRRQEGN